MTTRPAIYELGPDFYDPVEPARFPQALLRYRNEAAAKLWDLENLSDSEWIRHFAGFAPLPGNIEKPLALRYHGHQFLHYNPDLGDGRGFLFAQKEIGGKLFDLGTKGSGQTPYSRQGDGRLTLKGAFREILATELLESYGVNTSRTFSVIETGENLERHDEPSPTRSAVLVRLCHGHIRFGTFQRLAFLKQTENIKKLTRYCLRHYYPHLQFQDENDSVAGLLREVCRRSADLVASWMTAGFVHGVMNTDNMNITGECFDYGPYRFLPRYNPDFTAAYFDHQGLYRFGRQPITMAWNLEQLALSLREAYPSLPAREILENFGEDFNLGFQKHFLRRLHLREPAAPEILETLIREFFQFAEKEAPLYEQLFFDLYAGLDESRLQRSPQRTLYQKESFQALREALTPFKAASGEAQNHSYFRQPKACTVLIDELEEIWKKIADQDDWSAFQNKLTEIRFFRGVY